MILIIIINLKRFHNIKPHNRISADVDMKTNVTPVILWANGNASKLHRRYLSNVLGKHEIKELLKKTAILGTAHKLRKVLIQKYETNFTCQTTLREAYIVNTEQLQHF